LTDKRVRGLVDNSEIIPRRPLERETLSMKKTAENGKPIFFKKQHKLEKIKINKVESRLQVIKTSLTKANEHQ